jgi:hypothetical protein
MDDIRLGNVWDVGRNSSCMFLVTIPKPELCGRVDSTRASYAEGPGLKSRPGNYLSWLTVRQRGAP